MAEIKHRLKKFIPKEFSSDSWRSKSTGMGLRHEMIKFTKAFRENFVTLIISSLGLLVALSWNNFWNVWVSSMNIENTTFYKFYIALGMTIFAVILTYVFSKFKNNGSS